MCFKLSWICSLFLCVILVLSYLNPVWALSPISKVKKTLNGFNRNDSILLAPPFPGYFEGYIPRNLYSNITEEETTLYFETHPDIKELIELYINEVDPTWLPQFGYAPFIPLVVHIPDRITVPLFVMGRNILKLPTKNLIQDFTKVKLLVFDIDDVRTLVRLENLSPHFFSEICTILDLLSQRGVIEQLKDIPRLLGFEGVFHELTTNPILFRLMDLYHASGPWLGGQIMTHGLVTLGPSRLGQRSR